MNEKGFPRILLAAALMTLLSGCASRPDGSTAPKPETSSTLASPEAQKAKAVADPSKEDGVKASEDKIQNAQSEEQVNLAVEIQQVVKNEGLDIDVSVSSAEHQLIFTANYFQDLDQREMFLRQMASQLRVGTKGSTCALGIWYLRADYSKGLFSSNVGRTVSLGCPQEKQAREKYYTAKRQEVVDELQKELNSDPKNLTHVTVQGNEMAIGLDNPDGFDPRKLRASFRAELNPFKDRFCDGGFRAVRIKVNGDSRDTLVPLSCGKVSR